MCGVEITDDIGTATVMPPTAREVIIQADDVKQVTKEQLLNDITMSPLLQGGVASDQPTHIYIVAPTNEQSSDKEDVMLSDLPIGKAMDDSVEQEEVDVGRLDSGLLPSLSNMQSIDFQLIDDLARETKLQTDSANENKPTTRMMTRGKKLKK